MKNWNKSKHSQNINRILPTGDAVFFVQKIPLLISNYRISIIEFV